MVAQWNVVITMIVLGAFYPAVDITTGEKERGTLETLLTLPVTNFQMIMSKYVAVTLFACVTAVVSMISLAVLWHFCCWACRRNLQAEWSRYNWQISF